MEIPKKYDQSLIQPARHYKNNNLTLRILFRTQQGEKKYKQIELIINQKFPESDLKK